MFSRKQILPGGLRHSGFTGISRQQVFLLAVFLLALGQSLFAADSTVSKEYQIKAAFLYNFTKFVEWPPQSFPKTNSPIVIAVLGQNPFRDELEKIVRDRSVNGHAIVVKNISSATDAGTVHLVFVAAGEEDGWGEAMKSFQKNPVLTVGESEKFAKMGGTINFTREGDKIRFEINQDSVDEADLKVNAQLLKLATKVHRKSKGL